MPKNDLEMHKNNVEAYKAYVRKYGEAFNYHLVDPESKLLENIIQEDAETLCAWNRSAGPIDTDLEPLYCNIIADNRTELAAETVIWDALTMELLKYGFPISAGTKGETAGDYFRSLIDQWFSPKSWDEKYIGKILIGDDGLTDAAKNYIAELADHLNAGGPRITIETVADEEYQRFLSMANRGTGILDRAGRIISKANCVLDIAEKQQRPDGSLISLLQNYVDEIDQTLKEIGNTWFGYIRIVRKQKETVNTLLHYAGKDIQHKQINSTLDLFIWRQQDIHDRRQNVIDRVNAFTKRAQ